MLDRSLSAILLVLLAFSTGCSKPEDINQQVIVVGSQTGMVHVAQGFSSELDSSVAAIRKTMIEVTSALDANNKESEVAKINRVGDTIRLSVSRQVFRAIDLARYYNELTGGAFDITTGGMAAMWGKGNPDEEELIEALSHSGTRYLELSDNGLIALTAPGITITPGHFAFAYAIDTAMVDRRKTAKSPCLLSWPNMARRDGIFPPETPPLVNVQLYEKAEVRIIGTVNLSNAASLAVIQQWNGLAGTIHVNPQTGKPATGTRLAAVTGPLTVKAYALAEALIILGREEGTAILTAFPGYEALVIPDKKPTTLWMTPGFAPSFTPSDAFQTQLKTWEVNVVAETEDP